MKLLLILVIGVVLGYFIGFGDAKSHDENFVSRIVHNVGGSTRDKVKNNADSLADSVSKP